MSVRYPPPPPIRLDRNPPIRPLGSEVVNTPLPQAPPADVQLPMLHMAPMLPPRGRQA